MGEGALAGPTGNPRCAQAAIRSAAFCTKQDSTQDFRILKFEHKMAMGRRAVERERRAIYKCCARLHPLIRRLPDCLLIPPHCGSAACGASRKTTWNIRRRGH